MPSSPTSPSALQRRLSDIERLLGSEPARADDLAGELLAEVPGQPMAWLFQGLARRLQGRPEAAIEVLRPLCESEPEAPLPHLQLGLALREAGDTDGALQAMRRAVAIKPDFSDAWLALAHLLGSLEDAEGLSEVYRAYVEHAMQDPRLQEASAALDGNRPADAERLLRSRLETHPKDVVALRMLSGIAARFGRPEAAGRLLESCLALAPDFHAARHDYVRLLLRQTRPAQALEEVDRLLRADPANTGWRQLKAAILQHLLEYEAAAAIYEELVREQPARPGCWSGLGHCLRIMGRQDRAIAAYRRATALSPGAGQGWWNLANLKTWRAGRKELEAMRRELRKPSLAPEDRVHLHFALGKALEDRESFEESFREYAEGNRLRRQSVTWDATEFSDYVSRCIELFTPGFLGERDGGGAAAPDPIFVLGLPRSGSTLVEQILASHPEVEGTAELPQVRYLAASLAERQPETAPLPEAVAALGQAELQQLGSDYLERTRAYRKLGRPFFVDKTPNNFEHLGLILLALPRARIVDVRRHPMACGWSLFRHLFARGQSFSYDLAEIARYYGDYLRLMDHFDAVYPGRVHRVAYEALVEDTEAETRRLLEYCGLPFDAACLRFHENPRPVATPSSEQVRSPIFQNGMEQWRHFEPWLGPLRQALADAGALPFVPGA